jgi:sodium transport system permease protein
VSKAGLIYKKELKDTLRDRRTLATMFLVPMVAYPLMLIFGSEAIVAQHKALVVNVTALPGVPAEITEALVGDNLLYSAPETTIEGTEREQAIALLQSHDVVIAASATAAEALAGLGSAPLTLYFDESAPKADEKRQIVETQLRGLARSISRRRLAAHALPASTIAPMTIEAVSIARAERSGNRVLGLILPTLVLTFIAVSCFYPAVDLTAGEKERKTLATLLSSPVRIIDVVLGKYLAVLTVGSFAGLLNVTVLGLTMLRLMVSADEGNLRFEATPLMVIGILLSVIALAGPVAAVMLGAASLARSFRDASTLLTPVLLVCLMPLALTMSPDTRLSSQWAAVPLAGAALLIRALLAGEASIRQLVLVLLTSASLTTFLLFLVTRIFADERALFSNEGRRADLKSVLLSPPPASVASAAAFAGIVFILHYYGGLLLVIWPAVIAVPVTQVLAQIAPAALLARWMRPRIAGATLLGLSAPSLLAIVAAVLVGAGAWLGVSLPAAWLTDAIFAGQAEAAEGFAKALDLGEISLVQKVLAFAIVPAICEELAFRGAVYGLLAGRLSPKLTVLVQAVIFGAFHGSVHRLLPTTLLGGVLGDLRRRTGSIVPGIVVHALTNSILMIIDDRGGDFLAFVASPSAFPIVGLALVGAGLWMARGPRSE